MVAGGSDISGRRARALPRSHVKHQIGRRYARPAPLHDSDGHPGVPGSESMKVPPYRKEQVERDNH